MRILFARTWRPSSGIGSWSWAAACLLLGCAGAPPPAGVETEHDTLVTAFVGVDVVPMTAEGEILADHTVLVEGETITAVGPRERVRVPAEARRIDGAGRFLIPGLADLHVHLEYFESPDVLRLFLANGVTFVRNMDGREHVLEWRDAVAAGELLGPTIYTAGPLLDGDPPILPDNTVVRSAEEARRLVAAQTDAGYDFVKVYGNLPAEAYRAVLEAAEARGLPVAGHVPREIELEEALVGGQAAIEHLADYGDAVEADDSPYRRGWHWSKLFLAMPVDDAKLSALAERVARAGVWTVPTMVQARRGLAPPAAVSAWRRAPELRYVPATVREEWEERIGWAAERMDASDWELVARGEENRRRLVAALHEADAPLLVGTDTPNPFVTPGFSVVDELESLVDAGLSPAQALAAATREAARFFGELDRWGTLAEGLRADLVLLEADPLDDVRHLERRAGVMVRGRWLDEARLQGMLAELRARP